MPHRFASPGFSFSGAIVRDEKSKSGIRDQVQIAVEVLSVAGMPNDSVPVSGLFVEAKRHSIDIRQIRKLAGVHHLRCFWTKDLS